MADEPIKLVSMAEQGVVVEDIGGGGMILRSPQELGAYPDSQSDWIEEWAAKTPETTFVADRSGANGDWRRVNYADFFQQVKCIGQAVLNRDLSVDRPVMILSDASVNHALLNYGAMHVGVPVTPVSAAYSLMSQDFGKLKYILSVVTPGLIFVEDGSKFAKALSSVDLGRAEVVVAQNPPDGMEVTAFDDLLSVTPTAAVDEAAAKVGPDTIAKFLFTSGSTGQPKGVINTQRMLCSNQQGMAQVWTFLEDHPPVTVDWLPWNHTFGGNHNINMMLRNGGTMYIDAGKPAPGLIEQTVANLNDISPTLYYNVPRGFDMLLPFMEKDPALRDNFFKDLDVIFYAAAALTQKAWERIESLSVESLGEKVMLVSGWGATETAPDCTHVHWPISKAGVIGVPIPGTELKLIPNEEKLEIRVRGPNVMPGYWKNEELTAEMFDEDGFYCIGDAVKFEDPDRPEKGIVFDGRVSENFKLSSGTWVFVGGLRTNVVNAVQNIIQDTAIAGQNEEELGILVFPNVAGCRALCLDLAADAPLSDVIASAEVRDALKAGLQAYNAEHPGSSTRIKRALLMDEPPNIDANEITDKGYLNQSAVIARREASVAKLYSDDDAVILID
ncbi:MAG: feruloyl-CoA synthase [Rhodospirillaceae bacterium]